MSDELDSILAVASDDVDEIVLLRPSSRTILLLAMQRLPRSPDAWLNPQNPFDDVSQADFDDLEAIMDNAIYDVMKGYTCPDMNIIGEIRTFPYSPPTGWHDCNGDSLSKVDYAALYAVIGDTFGNADADHFFIPDLRGKFAMGAVLGGTPYGLGATGGLSQVTLTVDELPAHSHTGVVSPNNPVSNRAVVATGGIQTVRTAGTSDNAGGGNAHENLPPFVALVQAIYTGV